MIRVVARKTYNVLFLCTGNSARSIFAEAILNRAGGGRLRGFSAGSHPAGRVNPLAIDLLLSLGYPVAGLRSKGWEEFARRQSPPLDIVVTVCDRAAAEPCPVWPGRPVAAHWSIEDPAAAGGDDEARRSAFRRAFAELERRVEAFAALPVDDLDAATLKARLEALGRAANRPPPPLCPRTTADTLPARRARPRGKERPLRYISTRGEAPPLAFDEVLHAGVARDGGLYVPERWPRFSADEIAAFAGLSYAELAVRVMTPFLGGAIAPEAFARMVEQTYAGFDHPDIAPLKQLGDNDWLLELFHGPTMAFKDFALQLMGRLFDHVPGAHGGRTTIVGATSGDTGSAAIEGCRDRPNLEIFVLHPEGRISEVQRRQMTTVASANVHNIAIEGTFDDCQVLVKAMFADGAFRDDMRLAAFNSINWARVMAQAVYYFAAAIALGAPGREVAFAVPTGNFGDVYAGYVARQMGLPVARLVIATNQNDILARFLASGRYQPAGVRPSLSPSMDIQVASNFERLLFDLHDRDGARVARLMAELGAGGGFTVEPDRLVAARELFAAHRCDDEQTVAEIARIHRETGLLVDPHSAIGVAAGRAVRGDADVPMVALATAHPAKFPEAMMRATGARPALPPRLADLFERAERYDVLPNDLAAVQALLRGAMQDRQIGKGAA